MSDHNLEFEKKIYRLKKIVSLIENLNKIFYHQTNSKERENRIITQLEEYKNEFIQICSNIEKSKVFRK